MSRKSEQLDRIEAALGRVEAAQGDTSSALTAILSRLDSLDGQVADLAQAVAVVMAVRKDRAEGEPDLSDVLAEVRAVRELVTPPEPQQVVNEITVKGDPAEAAGAVRDALKRESRNRRGGTGNRF